MDYHHTMVSATLVALGHNQVVPLAPEFIVPQDGSEKQDCESRAARRWLAAPGPGLKRLKPVYLGDDLYSRQPICESVQDVDGHFLFVAKPSSHLTLYEWLAGIEPPRARRPFSRSSPGCSTPPKARLRPDRRSAPRTEGRE
ncbi:MAG: hypothetical protein V3U93_10375 [Alphaproteobacteria bacterium]